MRRKAKRKLSIVLLVLLVLGAAAAASLHKQLNKVPHVRVGPLASEAPAKDRMRFFAVGDTGSGNADQYKVAAAMETRCKELGADGIWLLGDNAYPAGFASVEDPQWQTKILKPYGSDCLAKLPIYAVLGNHDYQGNPGAEIEFTLVNPRWHMPNRFYSVDFGKLLRLVAIDSNFSEVCFRPAFCGIDFMMQQVDESPAEWTVVIAHHPLQSASDKGFAYRGGVRGMLLTPILCNRIDAYISGHSHHLEAREPDACRMRLFVAGGGGGDLYHPKDIDHDVKYAKSQYGFLEMDVARESMTSRFIDAEGKVVYEASRPKRSPTDP